MFPLDLFKRSCMNWTACQVSPDSLSAGWKKKWIFLVSEVLIYKVNRAVMQREAGCCPAVALTFLASCYKTVTKGFLFD